MSTTEKSYIDVFFYGLYMDPLMLEEYRVEPRNPRKAVAPGRKLVIGKNATLIRDEEQKSWGMVYSLSSREIDLLYKDAGLDQYRPEALSVVLEDDSILPVLCYTLTDPPADPEPNPSYTQKLRVSMKELGLDSSGVQETKRAPDRYDFTLIYPDPDHPDLATWTGLEEITQSVAIRAAILGIDHYKIPWLVLRREDGEWQTIFAGSSWMHTPLLCVSKKHSIFRDGFSEKDLLELEPALTPAACGWSFSDMNIAMDGMASKYMSLHIGPKLSQVFEKTERFKLLYHGDTEVVFPDWFHGSSHADQGAVAFYNFPDSESVRTLEKEIAGYVRQCVGWFAARSWRKQYRGFYGIADG